MQRQVEALIREYIPHAPNLGLYVAPEIPKTKLGAAWDDYAGNVQRDDVLALYDATRLGSGKDGALFLADRLVFQNNNLTTPRTIRYDDIVRVDAKRKLLGGRKVEIDVNQGRATVTESIDFSGRPDAAEYVERFLREAMLASPAEESRSATDAPAVQLALDRLVADGLLTDEDRLRMLEALGDGGV